MDTIIDLISPRKSSKEELIEESIKEKDDIKAAGTKTGGVRSNLVRAPKGYVASAESRKKDRFTKRNRPGNLVRPQSRGRSKENRSFSGNGVKTKPKKPLRAASHGYLRATESYKSKRYVRNEPEKRRSLASVNLTKPSTFNLHTRDRARRHSSRPALSQAQRDDLFMKNLKPFIARDISERVMHSNGDLGLPRVKKRPTTEVKEFKFRTSVRASSRGHSVTRSTSSSTNTSVTSHPRRSLSRPTKPRIPQPRRVSNPTMFQRSYQRHLNAQNIQNFKAKEEQEKLFKMREFKAQPLPDFSKVEKFRKPVPKKPTIPVTPKTLIKSRLTNELMKQKIERQKVQQRRESNFHASALPDTTYSPEVKPGSVKKALTMAETPKFASDSRAIDRQMYDEKMKDIRERQEKIHKYLEKRKEQQEKAELKQYRRSLIHRPLPLPVSSTGHCEEHLVSK